MTTDILSPKVREAWETVNNWCLGRSLRPLNIIKSALVRGAEAERKLGKMENKTNDEIAAKALAEANMSDLQDRCGDILADDPRIAGIIDEKAKRVMKKLQNMGWQITKARHPMQGLEGIKDGE